MKQYFEKQIEAATQKEVMLFYLLRTQKFNPDNSPFALVECLKHAYHIGDEIHLENLMFMKMASESSNIPVFKKIKEFDVICNESNNSTHDNKEDSNTWKPIETAPNNLRVIIASDNEMAMGWLDTIDNQWYYAPQGGLVKHWIPTKWQHIPE